MREIVLDTETTGLKPSEGHRIVEIGCIELMNHVPTGRTYHNLINPRRTMDEGAQAVTGITDDMLRDKAPFESIVDGLDEFLEDAPLVIHNAEFDIGFLNAEYARLDRPLFPIERAIDTMLMARRKFPGAPASLDALCKRFGVDTSARTKHGALLDAQLLAEVYLELIGGRQTRLELAGLDAQGASLGGVAHVERPQRPKPLPSLLTEEEKAAHDAFVKTLKGDVMWKSVG